MRLRLRPWNQKKKDPVKVITKGNKRISQVAGSKLPMSQNERFWSFCGLTLKNTKRPVKEEHRTFMASPAKI
jgi:hypothetical protein